MAKQIAATQTQETEIVGISPEDGLKAVEIVKSALSYRPFIKEGIFGEKWKALSDAQQIEEFLTPRIGLCFPDKEKNFTGIFLRITGDEGPLVEAFFYPIEAAWSFLDEARQHFSLHRPTDWTDDQVEKRAFESAVDMMLIMIDNLYARSKMMMQSFTMETIAQWNADVNNDVHAYVAAKGDTVPKPKNRLLDDMLKIYNREVKGLWNQQGKSRDNWAKVKLVDEYEKLLDHWRLIYKMVNNDKPDWREYAKAGSYEDTPDDLLKKLESVDRSSPDATTKRISELALEHAARRAGRFKRSGVSVWAREQRQKGILVSDYSDGQLFSDLKEGRELKKKVEENKKIQDKIATYPEPEKEADPALVKKRKSFEQKLEFVKKNSRDLHEPNDESAMKK